MTRRHNFITVTEEPRACALAGHVIAAYSRLYCDGEIPEEGSELANDDGLMASLLLSRTSLITFLDPWVALDPRI